ncbi:nonsense-mediated mRNA decay protein 2-like [Pistacia vera]|uniref:nonsense-mediated mRNA decay protein 2-like n=1 Tax=Pistacia vera TaxID=55513 RepID=UPI001263059B|nr:nonsense-mediated mRNA decay protein 2-like [Pistacia vera]
MKEANGERNEALLELNDVYGDDDVDEDDDSDEDNDDSTDDEDKDSDDDDDDKEGEDDKDEEKEEYEYPKLKAADCYKFSTEVEFENRFKNQLIIDCKEQCLILEEEKKDLTAKLAAASESLGLYLQKEKDYLEDRSNWFIKRQNLSLKLDDTQACLEDNVNESRKLREERDDLSSKLSAQTSYAEYYHKLFQETEEKNKKLAEEMEETNRKLEEEENDLVAKLCAAKARQNSIVAIYMIANF